MNKYTRVSLIILISFLAFLLWKIVYQVGVNIAHENGYTLGDWLINYHDGGYKRRGLSGSFFIILHDYLGIPIKTSVYYFQIGLYIIFLAGFVRLAYRASVSWLYLGLVFCTGTFLFMIFEPGSIGRKEILLFTFYVVYLNLLDYLPKHYNLILGYLVATSVIGILFHEIYFFYLPFFLLPLIFQPQFKLSRRQIIVMVLWVGGVSVALVGGMKIWGADINAGSTFEILTARGISNRMESLGNMGILTWNDDFDKMAYFKANNYWIYIFSLITGSLIFFLFSKIEGIFKGKYDFLLITLGTLLVSLPAYILAIDWGRWLHIQFIMMLIYFTYVQDTPKTGNYKLDFKVIIYLLLVIISGLLWRFDLVDKGFYISRY